MKEDIILLVIFLFSGLIFGCRFIEKDNKLNKPESMLNKVEVDSILYHKWIIKKLNGIEVVKETAGNEGPYIEFHLKSSELSGYTGCNDVSGKALITGNEIKLSEMSMSKMYCPEAKYEKDVVQILFYKEPLKYKIDNGNLVIFKDGEEIMVFEKTK